MKKVLIPLAEGFEEIEAVTIIDILRRAGALVTTAGLKKRNVTGSHELHLVADTVLAEVVEEEWDLVVLPGGVPGTPNLLSDEHVLGILRSRGNGQGLTAAICAAPAVLEQAGLLQGRKVTSHPGWADRIPTAYHTGERVQTDERIITGQAAGSAMEFAFQLVESMYGRKKVEEVNQGVLARI